MKVIISMDTDEILSVESVIHNMKHGVSSPVHNSKLMKAGNNVNSSFMKSSPGNRMRVIFPVIHDNTISNQSSSISSSCQTQQGDISYSLSHEEQESYESEKRSSLSMVRNKPGHHYQLASTPRCLEKSSSTPEKAATDVPNSILRRKTSSQSSLSVISEDGKQDDKSDANEMLLQKGTKCVSPPTAFSKSSSLQSLPVPSIPSSVSNNSLCSDDCIMSLVSQIDYTGIRRSHSGNCIMNKTKISRHKCVGVSFDPRIWVFEYELDKEESEGQNWYNVDEIENFKSGAIACIKEQETYHLSDVKILKVFFNHPALVSGCSAQVDTDQKMPILSCSKKLDIQLKTHIKNILIVDPNELFLRLFKRGFEYMLPHVSITTAKTGKDAMQRIKEAQLSGCSRRKATHGFDIVLMEEQMLNSKQQQLLHHTRKQSTNLQDIQSSGSFIFQKLALEREEAKQESTFYFQGEKISHHTRYTLFIGISGHGEDDHSNLIASGADIVWTKPPPTMNQSLRNELLCKIVDKRNLDFSL